MRDGMTIIKSFTNETEAQVALAHLEAMGIKAFIEADNCGGMRPHLDLTSGVHLLVNGLDGEKAAAVLQERSESSSFYKWICGACGETSDEGYDACWKCGAAKD